jgi:hypothetical protein
MAGFLGNGRKRHSKANALAAAARTTEAAMTDHTTIIPQGRMVTTAGHEWREESWLSKDWIICNKCRTVKQKGTEDRSVCPGALYPIEKT